MKKWQKKAIEEIMNEFDFNKVRNVMVFLNWSWSEKTPPSIKSLRDHANRSLTDVCEEADNKNFYFIEGGGFKTMIFPQAKRLSLEFVVTDWEYES